MSDKENRRCRRYRQKSRSQTGEMKNYERGNEQFAKTLQVEGDYARKQSQGHDYAQQRVENSEQLAPVGKPIINK